MKIGKDTKGHHSIHNRPALKRNKPNPLALERKLKKEASHKGLSGDRANAYVYGTLRKTGWTPKREH